MCYFKWKHNWGRGSCSKLVVAGLQNQHGLKLRYLSTWFQKMVPNSVALSCDVSWVSYTAFRNAWHCAAWLTYRKWETELVTSLHLCMSRPFQMFSCPVSNAAQLLWRETICPAVCGSCGAQLRPYAQQSLWSAWVKFWSEKGTHPEKSRYVIALQWGVDNYLEKRLILKKAIGAVRVKQKWVTAYLMSIIHPVHELGACGENGMQLCNWLCQNT